MQLKLNLIIQKNLTTPYKMEYKLNGPYSDSLIVINYSSPAKYSENFTGKWEWKDKKKSAVNASYLSGNLTKLSYKEIIIDGNEREIVYSVTHHEPDDFYFDGYYDRTITREIITHFVLERIKE